MAVRCTRWKEARKMDAREQRERAVRLRQMHRAGQPLVLPNVWDAASARIVEGAGFGAIATTSSGVATALGYPDGERIGRDLLIEVTARIIRAVACPVTADIEAGYGDATAEVLDTVRRVIEAGAVGFNIEDSRPRLNHHLVDLDEQVALIQALRQLAATMDVPFVINARVDVFLHGSGELPVRIAEGVRRGNAYLAAGADCVYPIGTLDRDSVAALVAGIAGPVNMLGGPGSLTIPQLAALGVARVSLGGRVMSALLGHLRAVAREVLEQGTYTLMSATTLSGAEFGHLFAR